MMIDGVQIAPKRRKAGRSAVSFTFAWKGMKCSCTNAETAGSP
jgi:hypothetical protein